MFEKFTRKDAGDFRQRYQGTYGYFRRGNKKTLVRLDKVDAENGIVVFVDQDGLKYDVQADASDDSIGFDFLPPKMSYHNTPSGTYLLRRVPSRQYSRGISERNISIKTLSGEPVEVGFQALCDIFERPTLAAESFVKAKQLKSGSREKGFALSSQFAIDLVRGHLFCFNEIIGAASLTPDQSRLVLKLKDYTFWGTDIKDALIQAKIEGVVS